MEKRRVWVFYAVLVSMWAIGFGASLTRFGAASRNHQQAVAATHAPAPDRFATATP